ncbi:MAG: 6-bladed beta-propeller [Gemmatimonadota bacterium]|nr:MAG: 6-bladed beta-propeller [Gemmatimonadota bacterium]
MKKEPELLLIVLSFVVGCGTGGRPEAHISRDSAGVTISENHRGAWGRRDSWQLSRTPLLDIGVSEGDPSYELFGASSSVRLTDGTIVIANGGTHELRWYDATGTFVRSVGRRGGGPGEFTALDNIAVLRGDSIVAYDSEGNRISVFSPVGEFARSATLQGPRGFMVGAFADGSVVITATTAAGLMEGLSRWTESAFRYAATGLLLDTLGVFPGTEWFMEIQRSGSRIAAVSSTSRPFAKSASFAASRDAFYAGSQDTYEIAAYSVEGDLTALVRRDFMNLPVTAADIDAHRASELVDVTDPVERAEQLQRLEKVPYPETMPAYGTIEIDTEGNLWVADYRRPGDDGPRWTVFDPEHRMLGTVQTPPGFRIHQIGSSFVLGRWRDELDVEHVQLYELIKP